MPFLEDLPMWLRYLLAGCMISAPAGPIGMVWIRRLLVYGNSVGLLACLGSASADFLYAILALSSLEMLRHALMEYTTILHLIGGGMLAVLGLKMAYRAQKTWKISLRGTLDPAPLKDLSVSPTGQWRRAYMATFFVALINPLTLFGVMGVLAVFGLSVGQWQDLETLWPQVAFGFIGGGFFWWGLLAIFALFHQGRLRHSVLVWIDTFTACLFMGCALYIFCTV